MVVRVANDGTRIALRAALDLLLPSGCAACGRPGAACCRECARELEAAPRARGPENARGRAAPRGPTTLRSGPETARERGPAWGPRTYALAPHDGAARELVLAYKERGRRDLARPLGRALARGLLDVPEVRRGAGAGLWLVPVPSRRSAARARGGQHVHALARECARALAREGTATGVAPALRLTSAARDAVGLGRGQRVANLQGALRPRRAGTPPQGSSVVLLDDVTTTGATVAVCSRVLCAVGFSVTAALTLTGAGR